MDILVLLAEHPDSVTAASTPLAHVRSTPDATHHDAFGRGTREVVTLYGAPDAERLAMALAAAVEGCRAGDAPPDAVRHLGVWIDRGAVGDVAWRDRVSGCVVTEALTVGPAVLAAAAHELLAAHGLAIRQTVAGLAMADWPEGVRRAIRLTLAASDAAPAGVGSPGDAFLASLREADGYDDGE